MDISYFKGLAMPMGYQHDKVRELVAIKGLEYKHISENVLKRNHSYLQQFVTKLTPQKLSDRDRKALSRLFDVDEIELIPPEDRYLYEDTELYKSTDFTHSPPKALTAKSPVKSWDVDDKIERLNKIGALREKDIIDEAEFQRLKAEIMD